MATEKEIRDNLITTAENFVGIKEGSDSHKYLIDVYNSITPLPRGYKMTLKDSWCMAFISAISIMAETNEVTPLECSCYYAMQQAKQWGIWRNAGDISIDELKAGDIVMYNWDDVLDPDHVGFYQQRIGEKLHIIEGNKDDAVGIRQIDFNNKSIMGFILPNYSLLADNEEEEDIFYLSINAWHWDGKGWWYPYGHAKGQYIKNDIVRINGELCIFNKDGYAVRNPKITTNSKGFITNIEGEVVPYVS